MPELLERLTPHTLKPAHQAAIKALVARLHEISGSSFGAIYGELNEAFHVGKYSDIPDAEWEQAVKWLQKRLDDIQKQR